MRHPDTNRTAFWIVAFGLLVFIEAAFLHNGNIMFLFFGAGGLYFGVKRRSKWLAVVGIVFIITALLNLWSLRLLILALLAYVLHKLWKGVPAETIMRPLKDLKTPTPNGIWKNKFFSVQSSPFSAYEWEDVHIQGFIGDIHVDVTDTVLPKDTSLIAVRQGIGRVKIDIPYEIPIRLHYTTLLGEARVFDLTPKRMVNETLHFKDGYETAAQDGPELIISLTTWIGDVEVNRK